jgi:arylsulfatase A
MPDTPNIIFILADDMGYGDMACQNPDSKIPTPNLDALASGGMRFTDAHASSSVCTPSRYALLTGRYAWRSRLKKGVLWPWDPAMIEPERKTVADMLREKGYKTACIGKWHLGWNWQTKDGRPANEGAAYGTHERELRHRLGQNIDFTQPMTGGPVDNGFDTYFGEDVPNFPPYTWFEQDRIVTQPTEEKPDAMFGMPGPMAPGWSLKAVMPTLTRRAVHYIENADDTPFFLYFPLTAPHTPIVPTDEFKGKSQAGDYGDFVCEVDWTVGQIMNAVHQKGIADNTLVIFTSDNGPENFAYEAIQQFAHYSMDGLRGLKRDTWEGGHRVPFIASWPHHIAANTTNDETICLIDFMATVAAITGASLSEDMGEDSANILPALQGQSLDQPIRETTVHHSAKGTFAIRKNNYVFIDAPTGDDNTEPDWFKEERGYIAHNHPGELFDLSQDRIERHNLYEQHPDIVAELKSLLETVKHRGKSQTNR